MPTPESTDLFAAFVDDLPAPQRSQLRAQIRKPKALRPLLLAIDECMEEAIKEMQRGKTIRHKTTARMQSLQGKLHNLLMRSEEEG